jgi:hypothetical protein
MSRSISADKAQMYVRLFVQIFAQSSVEVSLCTLFYAEEMPTHLLPTKQAFLLLLMLL